MPTKLKRVNVLKKQSSQSASLVYNSRKDKRLFVLGETSEGKKLFPQTDVETGRSGDLSMRSAYSQAQASEAYGGSFGLQKIKKAFCGERSQELRKDSELETSFQNKYSSRDQHTSQQCNGHFVRDETVDIVVLKRALKFMQKRQKECYLSDSMSDKSADSRSTRRDFTKILNVSQNVNSVVSKDASFNVHEQRYSPAKSKHQGLNKKNVMAAALAYFQSRARSHRTSANFQNNCDIYGTRGSIIKKMQKHKSIVRKKHKSSKTQKLDSKSWNKNAKNARIRSQEKKQTPVSN